MKILLVTNVIHAKFDGINGNRKSSLGGWVQTVIDFLSTQPEIELAVCMPDSKTREVITGTIKNVTYYFVPEKRKDVYLEEEEKHYRTIIKRYSPDIVNIFGTECPRTLAMVNASDVNKTVITIAGIVTLCAEHYMGQTPIRYHRFSLRVLLRPIFKIPTLWEGQKDFKKRGVFEIEAIKKAKYIVGRTRFDKAFVYNINKSAHYYHCNETLRPLFYDTKWKYDECIKHKIMIPQAAYPIKGFEVFLKALLQLKSKYPDVKVIVPGGSVFSKKRDFVHSALIAASDYNYYLNKTITKYDLWGNIEFVGLLTEEDMVKVMKTCNVFVLPSAIENSPNTLGEAMLMGMPCVASCVGGVLDLIEDSHEGYIYPYDEPHIMAYQIATYFENPELAIQMGENARKRALKTHDREVNMKQLLQIYNEIVNRNAQKEDSL